MNKEERAEWVARGYKDPVAAFRSHIATAKVRGIAFRMTFEEWWSVWAPHYEQRGSGRDCLVMCRTKDAGAYVIGNVRIDTVQANAAERGEVYRTTQAAAGRTPAVERCANPIAAAWVKDRGVWGLDYYSLRKLSEQDEESFADLVDNG